MILYEKISLIALERLHSDFVKCLTGISPMEQQIFCGKYCCFLSQTLFFSWSLPCFQKTTLVLIWSRLVLHVYFMPKTLLEFCWHLYYFKSYVMWRGKYIVKHVNMYMYHKHDLEIPSALVKWWNLTEIVSY